MRDLTVVDTHAAQAEAIADLHALVAARLPVVAYAGVAALIVGGWFTDAFVVRGRR